MNLMKQCSWPCPQPSLFSESGAAHAGQTINEAGAIACVTDKWDEKEA